MTALQSDISQSGHLFQQGLFMSQCLGILSQLPVVKQKELLQDKPQGSLKKKIPTEVGVLLPAESLLGCNGFRPIASVQKRPARKGNTSGAYTLLMDFTRGMYYDRNQLGTEYVNLQLQSKSVTQCNRYTWVSYLCHQVMKVAQLSKLTIGWGENQTHTTCTNCIVMLKKESVESSHLYFRNQIQMLQTHLVFSFDYIILSSSLQLY